jgi:hypothetical protein
MENIEGLTAQIEQLKPYQKSMLEKIVSQLSVVISLILMQLQQPKWSVANAEKTIL